MNAPPNSDPGSNMVSNREPVIELIEDDKTISITVELPGIEKENIDLIVNSKNLSITANDASRKYLKELELPAEVDTDTAAATYKNGVLDVVLKKVSKSKDKKAKGINIEAEAELWNLLSEKDNTIANLKKETSEKSRLAEDCLNKLQRIQSDFMNYKQRVAKEKEQGIELAKEELILKTIEVVDNFERALESSKQARGKKALMKGVEMIHTQLLDVLKLECVEPFETIGQKFDPARHEIVAKELADEHPEDTIIEELQKGYTFKSKIIRPAKVKVVKKKSEEKKE